jgi:hypothetical protein
MPNRAGHHHVRVVVVSLAAGLLGLTLVGAPAGAQGEPAPGASEPAASPADENGGTVIGGHELEISSAPWQVSLWIDDPTTSRRDRSFTCGGSILSRTVVITAAHCLYDRGRLARASEVWVAYGTADPFPASVPLRPVSAVAAHPQFLTSITDDVAYLRLSSPVDTTVPPVPTAPILTAEPGDEALYPHGGTGDVSGWGSTDPSGETDYPHHLRGADVPFVGDAECIEAYDDYGAAHPAEDLDGSAIDAPTMLCAGSGTVDTCFGDSGGPLWIGSGEDAVLVGITSFGPPECADDIAPGVYTEVAAYADMTAAHLAASTAPPFTDVRFGHPFLTEVWHLQQDGILSGYPDGTYRSTLRITRQAMSAFLYRLAGEPAFSPPEQPTFTDVGATTPFRAEIEWLAAEGVSTGFDDGTYRPGEPVTRGAMSAFMYRAAGEPTFAPPTSASFTDVRTTHPFFLQVEWLADEGITTGYADATFRPAAPVTRQSMAAFLYRLRPLLPT